MPVVVIRPYLSLALHRQWGDGTGGDPASRRGNTGRGETVPWRVMKRDTLRTLLMQTLAARRPWRPIMPPVRASMAVFTGSLTAIRAGRFDVVGRGWPGGADGAPGRQAARRSFCAAKATRRMFTIWSRCLARRICRRWLPPCSLLMS